MIVPVPKEPYDVKREIGDYCLEMGKCTQIVKKMANKSKIRRGTGKVEGFSILMSSWL